MSEIDFSKITACGECCTKCPKKVNGKCPGCIEADGYVPKWTENRKCKVHSCTKEHNVQFCGICNKFPCEQLTSIIHWNLNIVEHMTTLKNNYNLSIHKHINTISDNKVKNIALDFISFLIDNDMEFERAGGYWENQSYWYIKYNNEYVCYILVNGTSDEKRFAPLTVWTDDSNSHWYSDCKLENSIKNIAISHIDICEKCGACNGGTTKNIFGKQYDNICRTTFRFINPDLDELKCLKKLILLRKSTI